jgi:hypothetical protein
MSFVFVSHADADKLRIKPITDRLIKSRWKLFIDRPDDMGYSSDEIRQSIVRLRDGELWLPSLDRALAEAPSILLFVSKEFLRASDRISILKREVLVGDFHRKLVTVRIDDFDLRELGRDFPLTKSQYLDLFLPHGEGPSLDRKIDRLNEAIEEKFRQARTGRKGPFRPLSGRAGPRRQPTDDQIERFVMMLDREAETSSFCLSPSRLSIVQAYDSARPWYFKQRLAERELPRMMLQYRESREAVTEILENRWDRKRFSWVPSLERGEEHDKRAIVEQILRAFSDLRPPTARESDQACIEMLLKRLCSSQKPVLLTAYVEDKVRIRSRNSYLIRALAGLLEQVPEDRCRMVIRVGPAPGSRPATKTWLGKLAKEANIGGPIALGEIQKQDLYSWCEFMENYVERTAQDVFDCVSEIFGARERLTFQQLELEVKPVLQKWHVKPTFHIS